jgi:hypothetical protein
MCLRLKIVLDAVVFKVRDSAPFIYTSSESVLHITSVKHSWIIQEYFVYRKVMQHRCKLGPGVNEVL